LEPISFDRKVEVASSTLKPNTVKYSLLTLLFLVVGFAMNSLSAQQLTLEQKQIINQHFSGNHDYYRGYTLSKEGNTILGRTYFNKAAQVFKKNREWSPFIAVNAMLMRSYAGTTDYQKGIKLGQKVLKLVKRQAPELMGACGVIHKMSAVIYQKEEQLEAVLNSFQQELMLLTTYYSQQNTYQLALCHLDIATTYDKMSKPQLALTSYNKAKDIFQQLDNCEDCAAHLKKINIQMGYLNCNQAESLYNEGQLLAARPYYQKGVDAFVQAGHLSYFIQATADLLHTYGGGSDYKEGISIGEQALKQVLRIGPDALLSGQAKVHHQIGRIHNEAAYPKQAIQSFEKELTLLTEAGEPLHSKVFGDVFLSLGLSHMLSDSFQKGIHFFRKAKAIFEDTSHCQDCEYELQQVNEKLGIGLVLLGKDQVDKAEIIKARKNLREGLALLEINGDWRGYLESSSLLMETYIDTENYLSGIEIGENTLSKITKNAPSLLKDCDLIYQMMGLLYNGGFQTDLSLTAYQKQLQSLVKKYGPDTSYQFALAYNNIAACYSDLGKLDTAILFFDKAIETYQRVNDCQDCSILLSQAYGNRGNMYFLKGEMEEGIAYLEKAIALSIDSEGQVSLKHIRKYLNLAYVYYRLEEVGQSLTYLNRILFLVEQSETQDAFQNSKMLAETHALIGSNHLASQNYEQAIHHYQEAIRLVGPEEQNHPVSILSVTNLARVYTNLQNYEQANLFLAQAQQLFTAFTSEKTNRYFETTLGIDIQMQSNNFDRMTGHLDGIRAIENYHDLFGTLSGSGFTSHNLTTRIQLQLAQLHDLNNDIDSAYHHVQQALFSACGKCDTLTPFPLPSPQDLQSLPILYEILHLRAHLLVKQALSKSQQIEQEALLREALETYALADEVHMNNLKEATLLRGSQYKHLVEKSLLNYQEGIGLAAMYFDLSGEEEALEKAFYFTQQMKAQQLWLSILESEASTLGNLSEDLLREERDLLTEINFFERKLFEAQQRNDTKAIDTLQNQYLFEKTQRYQNLLKRMEKEHPSYFEAKYATTYSSSQTLQSALKEGELLIEYVQSGNTLYIFTLTQDQPLQLQQISFLEESPERIAAFRQMLENTSWVRRSSQEKFILLNYQLYQQFLSPIQDQLAGKDRLLIIHDGPTHYIPFEVLIPSSEFKRFGQLDYLLKRHQISYHYSARLLEKTRRKERNQNNNIFAFAPIYDTSVSAPSSSDQNPLKALNENGQFAPLPSSEQETRSILNLFDSKGSDQNIIVLRQKANEASLKTNLEKPFQFIHIAGHSFSNPTQPKFSGIACFPNTKNTKEDGILYAGEIYNLNTQTDLITLSSCESGAGRLEKAEGIQGLNRAFVYAGTPNVIFSLWKVYDKVSAEMMIDFYTQVLSGRSYAAALRQAKLNLLKREVTAAPHFWSPYVLIGR